VLPATLFIASLGLFTISVGRYIRSLRAPQRTPAKEGIDVFSLSRTPTVAAGKFRYAILGLGQDSETGSQIVWVRSISSNRVGGFAEGEPLFGGPVAVRDIASDRLTLVYHNEPVAVPIQP
jgi:hypothetical protein